MSGALEFTGERFVPGVPGEIWYEHWHRYHFVAPLVAGREVLDIACGYGYGSALLARRAKHVTGGDISSEAIEHARVRYAATANVEFRLADCAALPFADASFDAVVSFETIEHIAAQDIFLDEVRRVLRPGGLVILSCPNKVEYTDKRGTTNEFHVRELYRDQLAALIAPRFAHAAWYGQRPSFYSAMWPEHGSAQGEIFEVSEATADAPSPGHARPLYFIVVASEVAQSIGGIVPKVSILADSGEWIYRDYEHVTRTLDAAHRRGNALEQQLSELAIRHAVAVRQRDALQAAADAYNATEAERAKLAADMHAAAESERAKLAAELTLQRKEVARRAGLRWWLALPFRQLRGPAKRAADRPE